MRILNTKYFSALVTEKGVKKPVPVVSVSSSPRDAACSHLADPVHVVINTTLIICAFAASGKLSQHLLI